MDSSYRMTEDSERAVIVKVSALIEMKRDGRVEPTFLWGGETRQDNDQLYFLTEDGLFTMTGAKYQDEMITLRNWVVLSATVTKYPLDWLNTDLGTSVLLV